MRDHIVVLLIAATVLVAGEWFLTLTPAWDGWRASRLVGRETFAAIARRGPESSCPVDVFLSSGGTWLYVPWATITERATPVRFKSRRWFMMASDSLLVGVYHRPSGSTWLAADR